MRRSNEPRIYGPYQHGEQFRLHVVTGSGRGRKTVYRVYPTRDLAEAALAGARSQAQGTTVRQAYDAFIARMRERGLGDSTIETAEYRLEHILQLAKNGNRPLRWLASRGAELYAAAREKHAPDTHHKELELGKALGELCVAKKWLRANPFAGVEPVGRKTHGADKPRLTFDESRKLQAHCHELGAADRYATVTLAYLLFGARASEMIKRCVRDLDSGGSVLRISDTKTPSGTRNLVIPEELRPFMLARAAGKKPTDALFVKEDGSPATRHWANYHVKRLCRDAKVPELPPQALRRTNADLADGALDSAVAVSRHLGHAVGGRAIVTGRSYVSRDAARAAQQRRAFEMLSGGNTRGNTSESKISDVG